MFLLLSLAHAAAPLSLETTQVHPTAYAIHLNLDPTQEAFSGDAEISLQFEKGGRSLQLDAVGLTITEATLFQGEQSQKVKVRIKDNRATFSWKKAVKGEARLEVHWTGKNSTLETQGIFRQKEGDDWYLFSQFEPSDARRAFPVFDQPSVKVPWQLSITAPDGLGVYSNTPIATYTDSPGPLGLTEFAPTLPLPSYLVAFAIGPFSTLDAGSAGQNHVPVRIIVPRSMASQAQWAIDSTGPLLDALEAWFQIPYPYPKLDVVALPQAVGWGAMENPGLITCVAPLVAVLPEDDTPGRQQRYAVTMAHELAHQWFGDLVTPYWWDDIWLNESFASWMETRTIEAWKPDWRVDVDRVQGRNGAMESDSLRSARQIREPIRTFDDIENVFDGITYGKGQAVLEMFEAYLGPSIFQKGVQGYLQAHAHKNANTHDFLQALGTASAKDVETMFSTFLDQPGVPLITATVDCQSTPSLHLKQQRYLPNGETDDSLWQLPVCVRWGSSDAERACFVLDTPEASFALPTQSCPSYLVPNVDMRGYYRSRMTEAQFDQLLSPAVPLSLVEQIGLLGDASALVSSGDLGPAAVLNKLPALIALNIPEVLSSTVGVAAGLEGPLVPADLRGAYQQFLQQSYGPTARTLGFSTRPAETQAIRELRPRVLALVGGPGNDTEIQKEARKLTDTWLSTRSGVDPDMVRTVMNISARVGDAALFETIKTQALAETDRRRRGMLLDALGNFLDPALGLQALTLALSDQVDIREGFGLIFGPLSQEETREAAWGFIKENIDALADKVPLAARSYIPYTGSVFCDQKHYDEVKAFFEPKVGAWIGGKHSLDQSLESIQVCMATTARQAPGVRSFLTSRPGQVGP